MKYYIVQDGDGYDILGTLKPPSNYLSEAHKTSSGEYINYLECYNFNGEEITSDENLFYQIKNEKINSFKNNIEQRKQVIENLKKNISSFDSMSAAQKWALVKQLLEVM